MLRRALGAAALGAALVACSTTSPNPDAAPFMSGRVNGTAFSEGVAIARDAVTRQLTVFTTGGDVLVNLVLPIPVAPGTVFFGCDAVPSATVSGGIGPAAVPFAATDCYANGQVTFTTVDTAAHRVAGRFAFNGRVGDEAKPSVKVTEGLFAGRWIDVAPLARVSPSR